MQHLFSKYIIIGVLSIFFLSSCGTMRRADYGEVPQPKKYRPKTKTSSSRKKTTSTSTATVSASRSSLVKTARKYKGTKYLYGGETPRKGFDCSGFTAYVMDKHQISIPRTSKMQAKDGQKIAIKKVQPGDLLFFGQRGKVNHVGIVTQNKKGVLKVIHSTSSSGVIEQNVMASGYWKKRIMFARRVM